MFEARNDQRVTSLGRFLRRTRLDELPQLYNVLKGDMGLVGPRPEQVPFALNFQKEIPFYAYRSFIPPGLTGWAQIHQGYASGHQQTVIKLEHDLYYIKHMSLTFDLLIIYNTIKFLIGKRPELNKRY